MSLPSQTQVLVVGAGPNGMACALTLLSRGLQVTIVDALPRNRTDCRAVVMHARTLEVLSTIGLAEPLLAAGIKAKGATFHAGTTQLMEVDIGQLRGETEYPMVLLIPQDEIERIFREKLAALGVEILRPHAVQGLKESSSDGPGLEVIFDDGSVIRSQYLVGADGARSTVRHLANIDYKDPKTGIAYDGEVPQESKYQIALADVYFEEPLSPYIPRDSISFHLGKFFLLCPLPSEYDLKLQNVSRWRVVIASPPGGEPPPRQPDINWLQHELNDRSPWDVKPRIASVLTSSRYRSRTAVASTFFKKIGDGNVLLVGDAAHVHSPAGGQGLNVGLCDAVCLGNALHTHINAGVEKGAEEEPDVSLTKYAASRREIALRVVAMAGGITALVNSGEGWRGTIRNLLVWIIGKTPLTRIMAWRVSGLVNRDA